MNLSLYYPLDADDEEREGVEFIGLFDFTPTDTRQLGLSSGMLLTLVRRETPHWLRMRCVESGKVFTLG